MQAPGGQEEDPENGFEYGGWTAPYMDEESGEVMAKQMEQTDYLFGRKTFDIFESYWPKHRDFWPGVSKGTKYVVSQSRKSSDWENTEFLPDIEAVKKLKASDGPTLQVHGSGKLIQALLNNDLVDELWLKTFPVTLGQGKKLFEEGTIAAAFTLTETSITAKGVIFANYQRAGDVVTGTIEV